MRRHNTLGDEVSPPIEVSSNLGGKAVETVAASMKIIEMDSKRQRYFLDRDPRAQICLSCGDERCLCATSLQIQRELSPENPESMLRVFGGIYGMAHIMLIYRTIHPELSEDGANFPIDISEMIKLLSELFNNQNIVITKHSDVMHEPDGKFLPESEKDDIGCAFAANIGFVNSNIGEPTVIDYSNQFILDSDGDVEMAKKALNGSLELSKSRLPKDKTIERSDFNNTSDPVLVLEGEHIAAENTALVFNYTSQVSKPAPGKEAFYVYDVYSAVEAILKAFPGEDLDIEQLFAIAELQAFSTANILAIHTSSSVKLDMLRIETNGNRASAIVELSKIKNLIAT